MLYQENDQEINNSNKYLFAVTGKSFRVIATENKDLLNKVGCECYS